MALFHLDLDPQTIFGGFGRATTLKRLHSVNIHRGIGSAHDELPDGSDSREIANHLL